MLEVEVVARDSTVICLPKGDLDATTATTFRAAVALCLGEPGLIIDLSSVRFIDGAGLTALVGAIRRAHDQRTRVAVVARAGSIRKVLDGAGLDLLVSVLETLDLAIAEILNDHPISEGVVSPGRSNPLLRSARSVDR